MYFFKASVILGLTVGLISAAPVNLDAQPVEVRDPEPQWYGKC